jgi:hypothetical protein
MPKLAPPQWVGLTSAGDGGYLATPTRKANQWAPSMAKWRGCRALVEAYGPNPSAEAYEHLMGWPIGWTACEPLAMGKFQQWLSRHGEF